MTKGGNMKTKREVLYILSHPYKYSEVTLRHAAQLYAAYYKDQ
jgi:hypothetical protein